MDSDISDIQNAPASQQSPLWITHLLLLLSSLMFGAVPIGTKTVLTMHVSPFTVAQTRILAAGLLCIAADLVFFRGRPSRHDALRMMVIGGLGVSLLQYLVSTGLTLTSSLHGLLIMATVPMMTLMIGALMGKEQLTPRKLLGILIGFGGVGYLLMGREAAHAGSVHHTPQEMLTGDLLIVLNASLFANYLVNAKPYLKKYHPVTVAGYGYLGFLVGILALSLMKDSLHWSLLPSLPSLTEMYQQISHAPEVALWSLAFLAIGAGVLAYVFQNIGLTRLTSSTVASYMFLQPVFGCFLAWLILGEAMSGQVLAATVLILGGLGLSLWERRPTPSQQLAVVPMSAPHSGNQRTAEAS